MKHSLSIIFLLLSLILPVAPAKAADEIVEKTFCTQGIAYESIDALKLALLNNAKKAVIDELFGEFIVASTAVENFVVTKDQIQTSSIGFVRVEGNTNFHNGDDFADVCVTIKGYVTAEDRAKFDPGKLEKKYCDADDDLTTAQLIAYVKDEAVIQALIEYNPKLKGADKDRLLQLVQKVTYLESGFISDTQTYCAAFEGYVVPIEMMAFLGDNKDSSEQIVMKGDSINQWVARVLNFSSQYEADSWSANQVVGEPSVLTCGDNKKAWAVSGIEVGIQFVEVEFEKKVYPQYLIVRESNLAGFVVKLEFLDSTGTYHPLDVIDQMSGCPGESVFEVSDTIDFPTKQVKVYIDTNHSSGWEEIDAIALQGFELTNDTQTSDEHPYVNRVVAYQANGNSNVNTKPEDVLGPPDCGRDTAKNISLGGGYIIVEMGKTIIDGSGSDIRVHETGPSCVAGAVDEEYEVFASTSVSGPWKSLGQGKGMAEFDLAVSGIPKTKYIKIEDRSPNQPDTSSASPGADINAIETLH